MQHYTYTELLFRILEIIDYQNNKEKFVTEFETLNRLDAVASIIDTYPADLQKKVKACKTAEEISRYITENEYKDAYIRISQKELETFLASIAHTLSGSQKQRIKDLASY